MKSVAILFVMISVVAAPPDAVAYSVLSHEANVDALWDSGIRPLLVHRFPRATSDDLLQARAYAYGGSVIQDLGYYPFGSHFFTNLTHDVRAGDFVEALIREAHEEIAKLRPGIGREKVVFTFSQREYDKLYGAQYRKPGLLARFLGVLDKLLPKIGPLRPLQFKAPTKEAEALFLESIKDTRERYRLSLDAAARGL